MLLTMMRVKTKVELERMDAIAQYLESGTYPGWYSKNQRRSIQVLEDATGK